MVKKLMLIIAALLVLCGCGEKQEEKLTYKVDGLYRNIDEFLKQHSNDKLSENDLKTIKKFCDDLKKNKTAVNKVFYLTLLARKSQRDFCNNKKALKRAINSLASKNDDASLCAKYHAYKCFDDVRHCIECKLNSINDKLNAYKSNSVYLLCWEISQEDEVFVKNPAGDSSTGLFNKQRSPASPLFTGNKKLYDVYINEDAYYNAQIFNKTYSGITPAKLKKLKRKYGVHLEATHASKPTKLRISAFQLGKIKEENLKYRQRTVKLRNAIENLKSIMDGVDDYKAELAKYSGVSNSKGLWSWLTGWWE